ncbi:thiol-disulfide isomerase/thioredoxin [Pedobacter africanus]|uniref:Thiol-disulfide isomerase/thioredoxin n=1 Tax=Pedobacter africanus TaxID=151894 RepID=A0ACC6KZ69_9SPHI|nr:TlpA disulfide reductase family protein [Pedobacter africanus]MDR6784549.1 thiol-disulfide isomerase/thioredoxin [Pedobacter africanus]
MKKLILLLLISSSAWAQQTPVKKYGLQDFMMIEKVEDQDKYYNENKAKLAEKEDNSFRAELAVNWLAKGNLDKYNHYQAAQPKYNPMQFLNLTYALEKLFDEKKQYVAVAKYTNEFLEQLKKGTWTDAFGRTHILMDLNAAANAKLGNTAAAKAMIANSAGKKVASANDNGYFKDVKSNYLNRYAIVMSVAGDHKIAFDTLSKAFKEADSNPYMVATFKEIYQKVKGSDKGFEQYLKSLTDEAYQKYYHKVEKMYVESPALPLTGTMPIVNQPGKTINTFLANKPVKDITLNSLDGKPVNLADYNGKVLVLDFWSTGCTPCVAAFAGFEKVVADYKKSEFQLFVVNLFEPQAEVKVFAARKPVKLEILQDEENKAYAVTATPTKIIFDPMGNIRFFSSGYAGSTDREYYKLKAMVEITKARAAQASARQVK